MGGVVYMSQYIVISKRLYHLRGRFESAQNRRGLQLYPLQIAQVIDSAASNLLRTGTFKLHPHCKIFVHERHLACFGHEQSDLRAQKISEAI